MIFFQLKKSKTCIQKLETKIHAIKIYIHTLVGKIHKSKGFW